MSTRWTVFLVRNMATGRTFVHCDAHTEGGSIDLRKVPEELFMDLQAAGLSSFQLFVLCTFERAEDAHLLYAKLNVAMPHLLGRNIYGPAKLETKAQVVERTTAFRKKHKPSPGKWKR